jgi:hypothetical protein
MSLLVQRHAPIICNSWSLGIRPEKLMRRVVASAVFERSLGHVLRLLDDRAIPRAHELGSFMGVSFFM